MTTPSDPAPAEPRSGATAGSQTLARGLRALELLAAAETPLSIADLAAGLGVHRSNAYRVLRTLEEHRFVWRDEAGRIRLGPKLTLLARGVAPALHTAAVPEIDDLAQRLGMTAFVTVLDVDEAVTLITVEPSNVAATISRNPGVRYPVGRGAPGQAIESSLTPAEHEAAFGTPELSRAAQEARDRGYAVTGSELIDGVTAIAVPLRIPGEAPAAVAVVHFNVPEHIDRVVEELLDTADRIELRYR